VELAERVFSTRKGTILVAVGAAVLAGIILLVYVRSYRHNANANAVQVQVLVARSLIQKGTPGAVLGTQHLYQISSVPKTALLPGAYVDPSALTAGVAATDIFPGQQITAADFTPTLNGLDSQISGRQRALTFPIDSSRTLAGQLSGGDRIDIYISTGGIVKEILQNVAVLGLGNGTVTVRVPSQQAALIALAVDTGKIWFTLRPRVGAPAQPSVSATPANLLAGR
jgi:Flp pilus assembly protein CpaB